MKKFSLASLVFAVLILAGAGCAPSYGTPGTNAPQTGTPVINSNTEYYPPSNTNTEIPSANVNVVTPTNTNIAPPPANVNKPTTTTTIDIRNFSFNPAQVTVKKGTTVTWTNYDSVSHQIAGSGFGSNALPQGATYSYTFTAVGTYNYHCAIHPSMTGTIIVQ